MPTADLRAIDNQGCIKFSICRRIYYRIGLNFYRKNCHFGKMEPPISIPIKINIKISLTHRSSF